MAKENILVVESHAVAVPWRYVQKEENSNVELHFFEIVPPNLLELMSELEMEAAVLHPQFPRDKDPILEAHQAGKKIVIIKRRYPFEDDIVLYAALEEAGVRLVVKSSELYSKPVTDLFK